MSVRLVLIFRFVISALFIFSTVAKLLSLPFFDGMVAELFIGKDYYNHPTAMFWSQLFVRVRIAGEFLLGIAVLQGKYLKSIVLPAISIMLIAFTAHLFYAATVLGKGFIGGNCGCFGDLVPMDNFESIVKNIVSILMVGYIWKYVNPSRDKLNSLVIVIMVGLVSFLTLLLTIKDYEVNNEVVEISNVDVRTEDTLTDTVQEIRVEDSLVSKETEIKEVVIPVVEPEIQTEIEVVAVTPVKIEPVTVKRLLDEYKSFSNGENVDLYKGDKLICMFSMTCGHCQESYKDICGVVSTGKLPATYLLNYGSELDQNYFFSQAGCKHPHILIGDYGKFQRVLEENDFPRIIHMKDGKVLEEWNLETYSKEKLSEHFDIKVKKETNNDGGLELQLETPSGSGSGSMFGDY